MPVTISSFDIARYLKTDEDIQGFLKEVISSGDASDFIHALNIAAQAKGMTEIAKQVGITRASLYQSLAENDNPPFETILKIVEALGCKLTIVGSASLPLS